MTTIEPYVRSGAVTDIAVILTAIADGDPATALQASQHLTYLLGRTTGRNQCAAITHQQGLLTDHYQPAVEAVTQLIERI